MIEILILHELTKKVLTMYGIQKEIKSEFSVLMLPSYGTIKPALSRLEKEGGIKSQKTMSNGGRPSVYYSITNAGIVKLKDLLLSSPSDNPIQFLPTARIKISCSNVLNKAEQLEMFKQLKLKSELVVAEIKPLLESKSFDFYHKMVFDNLLCEYKNFISLLEGLERACKN